PHALRETAITRDDGDSVTLVDEAACRRGDRVITLAVRADDRQPRHVLRGLRLPLEDDRPPWEPQRATQTEGCRGHTIHGQRGDPCQQARSGARAILPPPVG